MHPGGQQPGMMGGAMGGPGTAMLNTIGAMDLTNEQRSELNTIREELQTRQQELADKLRAEGEKMRKLQEEQMRLGQTLTDIQGHMMQAAMDAANRAEELLTEDQRQAMINQGRHVMMRPGSASSPWQPSGVPE
jgi:septal ring factor EnvC (AmiA/AmiB activator)